MVFTDKVWYAFEDRVSGVTDRLTEVSDGGQGTSEEAKALSEERFDVCLAF